jgi:predicted nucleic acid-binding Zn ribbon protein
MDDDTTAPTGPEEPPFEGPRPSAPQDERQDDGLDLARQLTRATARSAPAARKRKARRDGRPRDAKVSGAHPDDRDPQLLGSQLDRLVSDRGWELELRVRGVFARWPELVGAEVGAHSTPESFAEGKLVVRTDSTAWATQMKLLAPDVVRRLNEVLGDETVRVIDVAGPRAPSWTKGRLRVKGRGPRDTYG